MPEADAGPPEEDAEEALAKLDNAVGPALKARPYLSWCHYSARRWLNRVYRYSRN